jgi:uncharacterized protein YjiS (DUF1127 family)
MCSEDQTMSLTQTFSFNFTRQEAAHPVRPALWGSLVQAMTRIWMRTWGVSATTRLNAHTLRDIGLLPEEAPQDPVWGHAGIMWRP